MLASTKIIVSRHWKAIIAILGAVLVAVQASISDGALDTQEYLSIGTAFLVAVGVYWVPNEQVQPDFEAEPVPDAPH